MNDPSGRPELVILCPCYNEQTVVQPFYKELQPVLHSIADRYQVKVVFLNNASTDDTLAEILKLRSLWPDIYVITYSRNVGYQRSLDCGLRNTHGDLFAFIDVDCEDPPFLIASFLEKYEEGYDVIYGERVERDEPELLRAVRSLFYRLLKGLADEEIILDMAEFGMFTAEVREAIIQDTNSFPFIRASIGRVGFRRFGIPFRRQRRIAGKTHYNLVGMTVFAIAGILSASTLFLRLPLYLLPVWLVALSALALEFVRTGKEWVAVTGTLVFASYIGATLAFVSLYVARGYKNTLNRPNAFIRRRDSILPPTPAGATLPATADFL